jgi:hypothetical protein
MKKSPEKHWQPPNEALQLAIVKSYVFAHMNI